MSGDEVAVHVVFSNEGVVTPDIGVTADVTVRISTDLEITGGIQVECPNYVRGGATKQPGPDEVSGAVEFGEESVATAEIGQSIEIAGRLASDVDISAEIEFDGMGSFKGRCAALLDERLVTVGIVFRKENVVAASIGGSRKAAQSLTGEIGIAGGVESDAEAIVPDARVYEASPDWRARGIAFRDDRTGVGLASVGTASVPGAK